MRVERRANRNRGARFSRPRWWACLPELSQIADAQKRFAQSAAIMGDTFAELCGHRDDKQYSLIGAGAIGLLHITTERLFHAKLRF